MRVWKIRSQMILHRLTMEIVQAVFILGRYTVTGSGPDCKSGALWLWEFKSLPAHWDYALFYVDNFL